MPTIRKRGKIWYIDYRIDGKRVKRSIGPSKRIAELELKKIDVKLSQGDLIPPPQKKSLSNFFGELKTYIEVNKNHNTRIRYFEVLNHFEEFLKNYPNIIHLGQINSRIMEDYKQNRVKKVAPKTV